MIEINLMPPQLRRKQKKGLASGGFKIPLEVVIGLGGGLIMLLILVHVGLLALNLAKLGKHRDIKNRMEKVSVQKAEVDGVISEKRSLQGKLQSIAKITSEAQILWSQKLNILSDGLPRGVWLKKISYDQKVLLIQGSAISRQTNEMMNVHSLVANLKTDPAFSKGFANLEMGSIQRREINKIEVVDFVMTADRILPKAAEEKK